MDREIPQATAKQVKRAARNHVQEMIRLHNSMMSVAVSAARLTEVLDRADGAPFAGGSRYDRADAAIGELEAAYKRLAALFDDL